MDSKTANFLTKLVLEDDEVDVVKFVFPNEKKRIKCSISMLAEISPVFEAMFSERWCEAESNSNKPDSALQDKIIKLDDQVSFNQYLTFKLFMQILYGLEQIDSLKIDQALGVYFYSHKYQIKDVEDKIQKFLNERMTSGMSTHPLSVAEIVEGLEFAQTYQLDGFKNKLDKVKLAFDERNPIEFWDLANKFDMETLKKQVLDHLKFVVPNEDWPPELLRSVITCLHADRDAIKKKLVVAESSKCTNVVCPGIFRYNCCGIWFSVKSIIPDL